MSLTEDQIRGAIYGLLVGDAVGVPYEFSEADEIPKLEEIEMDPPPGFSRAHRGVLPGTWSDDGAQALALLASLLECGQFDADDFGARLVRWYNQGYLAVDNRVFDIGITTGDAIRSISRGRPAADAGRSDVQDNGNGSLMRSLPLALWHTGSDEALMLDARAQSRVTHGHARAQICCGLYCLWARKIIEGHAQPWLSAVVCTEKILGSESLDRLELDNKISPRRLPGGAGSGYVVDTLMSARLALMEPTYESAIKTAISLGDDTDTTACVAGGIAGLRAGISGIPERWLSRLRGRSLVEPLLDELVSWRIH